MLKFLVLVKRGFMDPVVDLTMQKNYISRRKKELDEIVDLPLDEENIQKIELIAHKMKWLIFWISVNIQPRR
jgi:hypothetical protein